MEPNRWQHPKELFEAALQRPTEQRDAFLNEACRGDAVLLAEVESLLSGHVKAKTSFLDRPISGLHDVPTADAGASVALRQNLGDDTTEPEPMGGHPADHSRSVVHNLHASRVVAHIRYFVRPSHR